MRLTTHIISTLLAITIIACGNSQDSTDPVDKMTSLEQMEIALESGYTKQQIKVMMDRVMKSYGIPIDNENYSRSGSTLIVLRKEHGINEMDILDHMNRSYVPGVKMSFPEAAALSAVFLKTCDK